MHETQETQVQSLGWKDPLEEEMATGSSFLPGKPQGQRSLVGYSPWGCKRQTRLRNQTTTRKVTTNYFLQDAARELSPLFCSAGALVRRSLYYHGWEEPQCSQICRLAIPMATLFLKTTIHKYHFLGSACALFLNKSCVTHLCASTNTHTDPHTHQCLTDMAT